MYSKTTTVINRTGLHARPASEFTETAKTFTSKIRVRNLSEPDGDVLANAKSIISLLSLGMGQGSLIEISAEGDDEQAAVDMLTALVDTGFGEINEMGQASSLSGFRAENMIN